MGIYNKRVRAVSECYSRSQESVVMSPELPVVLPGGEVRAHGVLALLPQNLLNERWISNMNGQNGAKARLPHGPISLQALQLQHEGEGDDLVKTLQAMN